MLIKNARSMPLALFAVIISSTILVAQDAAVDAGQVDNLIDQLGSDSWETRENASALLGSMGARLLPRLKERLASAKDEEVRIRLEALIEKARAELFVARIEEKRAANQALYSAKRDSLHKDGAGKWFVIAAGTIFGPAADFDAVLAMAREKTAGCAHRYVFQAGYEVRKTAEPEFHGSLRSGDVGPGVVESGNFAFMDGKPFLVDPEKGLVPFPPAVYASPEKAPVPESPLIEIPVFLNTGFPGQVCLDPASALALGLHRFEIPGAVEGGTLDSGERQGEVLVYPARRAWVFLKLGQSAAFRRVEAWVPRKAENK